MSEVTRMRLGTMVVVIAPLVTLVGMIVLPLFDPVERGRGFRRGGRRKKTVAYQRAL